MAITISLHPSRSTGCLLITSEHLMARAVVGTHASISFFPVALVCQFVSGTRYSDAQLTSLRAAFHSSRVFECLALLLRLPSSCASVKFAVPLHVTGMGQ